MQAKIIKTDDGSSTIYLPKFDEIFHSINGAITESTHVYINSGLKHTQKSDIKIFEMGFGTGLNFILSYLHSKNKTIEYHAIEAFPLDMKLVRQLNYPQTLNLSEQETYLYYNFHLQNDFQQISNNFSITKTICKLSDYKTDELFDLIYFDAFGPNVQPELWTKEVFDKLFSMMNPNGVLTTFCAKGIVRRNMQECGFKVERLPGPPGKREILRAIKPSEF